MTVEEIKNHALNMRKTILTMAYECGTNAHLGGALSAVEMISALYGDIMNAKNLSLSYKERDKFILSKGHGALALYTALAEFGIISKDLLKTFCQDGSELLAHPVMNDKLGIEFSSGSLGQGISLGVGLALAAKKRNNQYRVYVLCGNGECNEGSVCEAVMSAINYKLDNFTIIVDDNKLQGDGESANVLNVSIHYAEMFKSLGCDTVEIDGHNLTEIIEKLKTPIRIDCPRVIVAHTIKGKGISFMENNNKWHHNRLTKEQYETAMNEIGGTL